MATYLMPREVQLRSRDISETALEFFLESCNI